MKTATELAAKLSVGIINPIMAQIDPMHVGAVSRAMEIGVEYGMRLAEYSENLKEGAIHRLANDYPAHSFVIDRAEAEELFHNVRDVESAERDLLCLLGDSIKLPTKDPLVGYLSKK